MPQYHPYSCLLSTVIVAHCQKTPSPIRCIHPVTPPTPTYLSYCGSFLEDTIRQQVIYPSYSPTSTMVHSWKIPPHQTTYPYCLSPYTVVHSWKMLSSHTVCPPPSILTHVAHLWKQPSPHTNHTSSLLPFYYGSFLEHSIFPYHPTFLPPPSIVVHS